MSVKLVSTYKQPCSILYHLTSCWLNTDLLYKELKLIGFGLQVASTNNTVGGIWPPCQSACRPQHQTATNLPSRRDIGRGNVESYSQENNIRTFYEASLTIYLNTLLKYSSFKSIVLLRSAKHPPIEPQFHQF